MAATYPCPHCGEELPMKAKFCRECGSDARTGWSDEAEYQGLDLPESMSDSEYDEFLARELGTGPAAGLKGPLLWKALVLLVAVAFLLFMVLR